MDSFMNAAAVQRLERYLQQISDVLGEESRRGSFALYASVVTQNRPMKVA